MGKSFNSSKHHMMVDRLRMRFATWTLAVAGSLTTSGTVLLPPSMAWGLDDPKSAEGKNDEKPSEAISRAELQKLLTGNQLEEAAERLDQALANDPLNPELLSMNLQLAMYESRANAEASQKRFSQLIETIVSEREISPRNASVLMSSVQFYSSSLARAEKYDEALAVIDKGLLTLADQHSAQKQMLQTLKGRTLVTAGKLEQAKEYLDGLWEIALKAAQDNPTGAAISTLASHTSSYAAVLSQRFPEASEAKRAQADTLVRSRLKSDDASPGDFTALMNLYASTASSLIYSDARKASEIIDDLLAELDALKPKLNKGELGMLTAAERSLKPLAERVKGALRRENLVGTAAPELDAEAFVAMDSTTMRDLKGKVVLIDFWAVWCGPCIATFPHLIHLQEEYGDKGLVILGVTRKYGYAWDEEAQRASRKADVTDAEEMAMLEKFREHHKLQHGFVVGPSGTEYPAAFEVTGIPQAVVIDQEGIIRLIKVGSGEENSKAIEQTIKQLLESKVAGG